MIFEFWQLDEACSRAKEEGMKVGAALFLGFIPCSVLFHKKNSQQSDGNKGETLTKKKGNTL